MLGRKSRDQLELFVAGPLEQLVPEDHVLARVDWVLDLSWLREEVEDCYCADNGRPGIDPDVAIRLMLAGLLLGMVHDRRLLREAHVNVAIRWFIGYGLHERLPDHSSLTRIRQRWGEARFREIFRRTVTACLDARIATAEVVHIDASLIRADVSWESLVERHVSDVIGENRSEEEIEAEKRGRQSGKYKKVSPTDADASMATTARNRRLEPCCKQHTTVDDVRPNLNSGLRKYSCFQTVIRRPVVLSTTSRGWRPGGVRAPGFRRCWGAARCRRRGRPGRHRR